MTAAPQPVADRIGSTWQEMADLHDPDLPGWSRVAFTEPDTAGRHWIADRMRTAGMDARIDAVGNVIGVLPGTAPSAPAIVTGSHTDTVPGGGRFDGVVGVLGAIEMVEAFREAGVRLRHELRVVDFANEEGNPQGVMLVGSRAISGHLTPQHLAATDAEGTSLADVIARAGLRPEEIDTCRWDAGEVAAFVELHIEQGPVLEQQGASLGIVTRIAGIENFVVDVLGRRDHAGTTPMNARNDALCAAAGTILAVERLAASGADSVGTVGSLTTSPEATNVVSEMARVTGEFRSPHAERLAELRDRLAAATAEQDAAWGTESTVRWGQVDDPTPMDDVVSEHLLDAARDVGHEAVRIYSGAGHDTVQMAHLCPTGMIFVPSAGGRSHCPEEWTDLSAVVDGAGVLAQAILRLDERL
ncbi:M20 family metallo-hydrolase [Georgenia alba]|uniref:M20 family metallo-hydrolase n=1 Tax=Georgenia alba TaxID=2233858 RepID=A0ABW2Q6G0_9MICO